ncbi:hypothetical protein LMG24238_03633 [Paraburkholderia sediminicola]|uniref:Uncharacterized protein n=1 Tax=Paraburkholderia sediminicola TaxID=458836 RepID=A0A6J5BD16_9BURK|nr:hypothetical protein LMG24238_03633 [Paraburkholderia sediminicola]
MNCTYQYQGFDIEVAVEADFNRTGGRTATGETGYVAVVRICKAGDAVAVFSPCVLANHKVSHFSAKKMRSWAVIARGVE